MNSVTPISLKKGDEVQISGARYRVLGQPADSNGTEFNLEELATGRFTPFTTARLMELYCRDEFSIVQKSREDWSKKRQELAEQSFDSRPEEYKEEARRRYAYVQRFYDVSRRGRSKRVLAPFIADVAQEIDDRDPPSPRTLCRWLRLWEDSGKAGISVLVPAREAQGNRTPRLHFQVRNIISDVIEGLFNREEKITVDWMHSVVADKIREFNKTVLDLTSALVVPSKNALYRKLAEYDQYTKRAWFDGEREAERENRAVGRGPEPRMPLEEVELDHHILDVVVIDEEYSIPIGRPWLTLALDRATRDIHGFSIGLGDPSYLSDMACLRNAIAPKNYVAELFPDIKNEWPTCGIPTTVVTDNGADYISRSFDDACASLGINVIRLKVANPELKGKVERFFGTLKNTIHAIPGTTFSNIKERGDYDSKGQAVVTMTELYGLVHFLIADIYRQRYHRGIKDSVAHKWASLTAKYPVKLAPSLRSLHALLGQTEYRKLFRTGVELFGLRYNSPELIEVRNRPGFDQDQLVKIKVDPTNIGAVQVEDPVTKRLIKAVCVDRDSEGRPYAEGMSLYQHQAVTSYVRKRVEGRIDIEHLARAKAELLAKVEEIARRHGKVSKRSRRFLSGERHRFFGMVPRRADDVVASSQAVVNAIPPGMYPGADLQELEDGVGIDVNPASGRRSSDAKKRSRGPKPLKGQKPKRRGEVPPRAPQQCANSKPFTERAFKSDLKETRQKMNAHVVPR